MIAIAIALAVVGLAAVLAAWSLGARWLGVTAARVRAADVEAVRAALEDYRVTNALDMHGHTRRIEALETTAADLEAQQREARLAKMGGRR